MILRKYTLENEFNGKKYHTDFDQTHSSSTPGERVLKTKLLLSRFFFIHATVGQMRAILVEKINVASDDPQPTRQWSY